MLEVNRGIKAGETPVVSAGALGQACLADVGAESARQVQVGADGWQLGGRGRPGVVWRWGRRATGGQGGRQAGGDQFGAKGHGPHGKSSFNSTLARVTVLRLSRTVQGG